MADLSTLGAPIKTAYEGEANTNAYTDAEKAKLAGISPGGAGIPIFATYALFSAAATGATPFFAIITADELSGNGQQAYSYDGSGGIFWFASVRIN